MKHIFTLILLCITSWTSYIYSQNQIQYFYDNAGNRISRLQITTRAFSPISINKDSKENSWENNLAKTTINIYPNPVHTDLFIDIPKLPDSQNGYLEIYDVQGKILAREIIYSTQTVISMRNFSVATYILRIFFGQVQST